VGFEGDIDRLYLSNRHSEWRIANGKWNEVGRRLFTICKVVRAVRDHKAFTLVEVVVILVVLSVLAAVAIPMAFRIFQVAAEDATREEMANLKNAMIGNPQKLQSSFRSDFGFLGDIGCMPAVLDRLLTAGGFLPYAFDPAKQAGAGWKGPYITGTPGEVFTTDQWGNNYTYTVPGGPCPLTADLTSNGPDIASTSDDITISLGASETTATVRGTVKDTAGVGLEGVPVEIYAPVNGVLTTTTATTDANGQYVFSSVPFGPRGVKARPRFVYSPGSVTVGPPGNRTVSFKMVNYSESTETIDRVKIDYTGGATWDQFSINGTRVDPATVNSTGQDINLTDTAISASPVARPAYRVFVDAPDAQLPDVTITGQGTSVAIDIRFSVSMTGIPITVTINPSGPFPISIVKFTP